MALEKTECSVTYQGGVKKQEYELPFPILEKSHIAVTMTADHGGESELAEGIDYEVVTAKDETGAVKVLRLRLLRNITGAWSIRREVPLTQEHLFHNQGPNSARVIELSLDKLTMIAQQFAERLGTGWKLLERLAAEIVSLSESTAERIHAARHRVDGPDPVSPLDIGAVADGDLRLSDARLPIAHSGSHRSGGSDPLAPADIGALGSEHAKAFNPHPQYALSGDPEAIKFFQYDPESKLLRLRSEGEKGAGSFYFVLPASGLVSLKGVMNG